MVVHLMTNKSVRLFISRVRLLWSAMTASLLTKWLHDYWSSKARADLMKLTVTGLSGKQVGHPESLRVLKRVGE